MIEATQTHFRSLALSVVDRALSGAQFRMKKVSSSLSTGDFAYVTQLSPKLYLYIKGELSRDNKKIELSVIATGTADGQVIDISVDCGSVAVEKIGPDYKGDFGIGKKVAPKLREVSDGLKKLSLS